MNHRLVVLDRAQKEIKEIQKRYQSVDPELATVFYSQLNLAITKIDQNRCCMLKMSIIHNNTILFYYTFTPKR